MRRLVGPALASVIFLAASSVSFGQIGGLGGLGGYGGLSGYGGYGGVGGYGGIGGYGGYGGYGGLGGYTGRRSSTYVLPSRVTVAPLPMNRPRDPYWDHLYQASPRQRGGPYQSIRRGVSRTSQ